MHELLRQDLALVAGGGSAQENIAVAGALGAGYGASKVISATPGGLGALGAAAVGVGTAAFAGLVASYMTGKDIGGWLYENSATVRETANGTVANVMDHGFVDTLLQGAGVIGSSIAGGMGFGGGGGSGSGSGWGPSSGAGGEAEDAAQAKHATR